MLSNVEPPLCLPHPPTVESHSSMCVRSVDGQDEAGFGGKIPKCEVPNLKYVFPLRPINACGLVRLYASHSHHAKTRATVRRGLRQLLKRVIEDAGKGRDTRLYYMGIVPKVLALEGYAKPVRSRLQRPSGLQPSSPNL